MLWFDRIFPAAMVLWPALFTLFVKRRAHATPDSSERATRLWIATAVALALHAAMQTWLEGRAPEHLALARGWPTGYAVCASMLLWFRFAMPAIAARDAGWRAPEGAEERRASLTPRHVHHPVPRGAWLAGWTLFALCAGVQVWAMTRGAHPVLLLGLTWWIFMAHFGARHAVLEPEPLDSAGSPELAASYASARHLKAWGFYALGLAGTLAFALVSALVVLDPRTAGFVGAAFGTALGLAGALFGTVASIRRARANRLLYEQRAS